MGSISWGKLTRDEATKLTSRWEEGRERRLTWLSRQLGSALTFDGDGLATAWAWYLEWQANPSSASDEPTPVWWGEFDPEVSVLERQVGWTPYTRDQAVGLDALGHYFEAALRRRFPQLERHHPTQGKMKHPWANENQPCLVLRSPDGKMPFEMSMMSFITSLGLDAAEEAPDLTVMSVRWSAATARIEENLGTESGIETRDAHEPVATLEPFDDDDAWPWMVEIDDVVANEREDLVAVFARDLAHAPGVAEVFHEDREQLLLSGEIDRDELSRWIQEWWSAKSSRG